MSDEPEKREARCVYVFPPGEEVVGMIRWRDSIIIATTHRVYRLEHDEVTEIRISVEPGL